MTLCDFYPRPPRGGRPDSQKAGGCSKNFYPRPPRGGRLWRPVKSGGLSSISIHALREEGDAASASSSAIWANFYPRPPRGGRLVAIRSDNGILNFYPRPPRGGRRSRLDAGPPAGIFLSTPSARRATTRRPRSNPQCGISIHALREEGDGQAACPGFHIGYFYPRPPRGGRQSPSPALCTPSLFLSTPSARRATFMAWVKDFYKLISIHALREEGDVGTNRT